TIIIFTSDNGAHREGGADPDFFKSSAHFRGYKRDLYEGGIRIPFIISWPGTIQAEKNDTHIAAFWDLMPTLSQLAGAEKPRYTDGLSFVPTLLKKGKQQKHPYLYWEFHEDGGRQAVRADRWKLVKQKVKQPGQTSVELYDLEKDPQEKNNVANKYPK